jgi:hypothetical protein
VLEPEEAHKDGEQRHRLARELSVLGVGVNQQEVRLFGPEYQRLLRVVVGVLEEVLRLVEQGPEDLDALFGQLLQEPVLDEHSFPAALGVQITQDPVGRRRQRMDRDGVALGEVEACGGFQLPFGGVQFGDREFGAVVSLLAHAEELTALALDDFGRGQGPQLAAALESPRRTLPRSHPPTGPRLRRH